MRYLPILLLVLSSAGTVLADRPNIILVMCDDLGYGDPKCFNDASPIETPHLDVMASNGLRFTRFYSAAPVCSPTRGSCLTGRHPYRYGIYFANVGHLKKEEITLPELLKDQGYTTGHFGKWHLGTLTTEVSDANRGGPKNAEHYAPPRWHGYDDSFVTESKVPTYDPMIRPKMANRQAWDALDEDTAREAYGTRYWDHQGNEVTENLRGDDSRIIMDRAIPFIERAVESEQPFFAAIWFHAPHLPVVAGKEHSQRYWDHGPYARNYYGCVTALDEQMGRLRERLRGLGVADQTILWFCSDNGPEGQSGKAPGSAGSLRGRKRSLYEGGVRVPAIVEWPGTISSGTTDVAGVTSDFLPTVLELLQVDYPDDRPLDGVSLVPVITGKASSRTAPIGFQSAKQIAWHSGHFKLYSGDQGKNWELYDLSTDPSETTNLAAARPELVKELKEQVTAWQRSCERSDEGTDYH